MELIRADIFKLNCINEDVVATIGQFDGLHYAHLELIETTKKIAKTKNLKSCVITFDPHPDFVLKKINVESYITPISEKIQMLKELEIDYLIIIDFTIDFASLEPKQFIDKVLLANNVKEVVVGYDFRFGKKGSGKASEIRPLSENKINTTIIDEIKYNEEKVGSTLIKELLKKGEMATVTKLLGRPFKVSGTVIKGRQVGRTINFPTANLKVDSSFATLLPGVYAVRVYIDNKMYKGIANLGHNPSFNQLDYMSFETHIVAFDKDLYGEYIEVELIEYLRNEIKFATINEFLEQIRIDLKKMEKILSK